MQWTRVVDADLVGVPLGRLILFGSHDPFDIVGRDDATNERADQLFFVHFAEILVTMLDVQTTILIRWRVRERVLFALQVEIATLVVVDRFLTFVEHQSEHEVSKQSFGGRVGQLVLISVVVATEPFFLVEDFRVDLQHDVVEIVDRTDGARQSNQIGLRCIAQKRIVRKQLLDRETILYDIVQGD